MSLKLSFRTILTLVSFLVLASPGTGLPALSAQPQSQVQVPSRVEFITAEQLKAQIAKNDPLAIIDVRATSGMASDERKVKGAIHVKLRRLQSRLRYAPLKDVPRDRQVVTYCACPSDEASIRAAELLMNAGFTRVRVLKGGWVTWKKVKGQMETLSGGD